MQSRQANKLYVTVASCGLVIPILTFVLTGDVHRSVYVSGHYGDSVLGWLQNTILLGTGMHEPHRKVTGLVLSVLLTM